MMKSLTVSILCTNYNKGEWIKKAIDSFLAQKTDFGFEIILIDDKSTDGSQDIIKEYAKKYPKKIRAFYNKTNLGITKTWIKICKEAKGKYIARCDGDDYWTDDEKLQKQVDALKKNKESKWCGTDCDIISNSGDIVQKSAFETGFFSRPISYAEMIATKGITAPSTWLVDTRLMQDINKGIDKNAVDDTFNIQLDLFNMTKYTYIPISTAVYRINEGSDSRPTDKSKAKKRDMGLLKTQLEYIEKYKGVDYEEIIKCLLARSARDDEISREAHARLILIKDQRSHIEKLEAIIKEKDIMIAEKYKWLYDIVSSRWYRAARAAGRPITRVKNAIANRKKK